jgi:PUA domain protein
VESGLEVKFKTLSRREARLLMERIKRAFPAFPLEPEIVERASFEGPGYIYVLDGEPCFWEKEEGGRLIPITLCLEPSSAGYTWLPGAVIVDKGAALALARGANLMVPGVREVVGSFSEGDIVAAIYRGSEGEAPIMVGEARIDSERLKVLASERGRGVAVKKLHHVGDKVWQAARIIRVKRGGARA